jgi:hypothetical protein
VARCSGVRSSTYQVVARLCVSCWALLAIGCGSKTGLDLPDAQVDGGLDAGMDATIPCIILTPDGGPIDLPLETQAELVKADVVFLIDTTASMQDEIDAVRDSLRDRLAPAIDAAIPDAEIAVATFADFPVDPFGDAGQGDSPFRLHLQVTDDLSRVQAAVNGIELGNGRDEPESQTEALFQVATTEGLEPFVPPSLGCPSGGSGYVCFRNDALPVVLLITDAPFHNGPDGRNAYDSGSITPRPHTYDEALTELQRLRVRVIGFDSGDGEARIDLSRVATDTGAVSPGGGPLVFDIGRNGERLGTGVVDAIRQFAEGVSFDIDLVLRDPSPRDGVDVTAFVESAVPLRAVPMDGVASIDVEAGVFRGVQAGTTVVFQLRLVPGAVVVGPVSRRFLLEVIFRGDGRTVLDRRLIEIVIPGEDGGTCGNMGVGP